MADETTTQTGEETSWWAFDAFADSELPSTPFDEPLEWPETLDWGDFTADDADLRFPGIDEGPERFFPETPDAEADDLAAPAPVADAQWQAAGGDDATMSHVTVLAGLGGGAAPPAPAARGDGDVAERLPDSLWEIDASGAGAGDAAVLATTMAAPTIYAEPVGKGGGWKRRFDVRHGNAAIMALICFVSLVLLGMFMSVRARNDLPDTSQTRTQTTSDQIAVQGSLNTIPLTTTVTTTAPAAINIADLLPPAEVGGTSATTAAPRATAPAAGSTGTTQPAAQTNTTAAPQSTTAPPVDQTTTPTSPPVDQTTTPTTPRRSVPSIPSVNTTVANNNGPTYTIPSIPGFPGFPNNN